MEDNGWMREAVQRAGGVSGRHAIAAADTSFDDAKRSTTERRVRDVVHGGGAVRDGDAVPVYRRFRERGRMTPEGLQLVSSWVDAGFKRCYQLMQTDDRALLDAWLSEWSDLVEFEVHPVLTSMTRWPASHPCSDRGPVRLAVRKRSARRLG